MPEAPLDEAVIAPLQHIQHRSPSRLLLPLTVPEGFLTVPEGSPEGLLLLMQSLADKLVLQNRHHEDRHYQRHRQHDGHRIREPLQEVVNDLAGREDEGEEGDTDDERRRDDAGRKLARRLHRRPPAAHAGIQFVQVAIHHHDAVIHNHTQRDNQRRQRDAVDLHAEEQEHRDGCEDGDRNRGHGDARHAQRQHQHHHDDDRDDGNQHLVHELIHGVAHDLALVADDVDMHVRRQRGLVLPDDVLHLLTKVNDVIALDHLQREQDAFLAVVLDIGTRAGVLALDGGDIADTDHLARGGAVEDGLCHVVLRIERRLHMDVATQLAVCQATRVERSRLSGELAHQHGRVDAVVGQAVAVEIDGQLLLLSAHADDIRQAGYRAQAVAEPRDIFLHLAIGLLLAFERDEHRRGIAEVIIGNQRQHTCRQRHLKQLQAFLQLVPELRRLFYVRVQPHDSRADAVETLHAGFLLVDFLERPQELLQRACQLLLHL